MYMQFHPTIPSLVLAVAFVAVILNVIIVGIAGLGELPKEM